VFKKTKICKNEGLVYENIFKAIGQHLTSQGGAYFQNDFQCSKKLTSNSTQ
jgi:hypothetical protein